MKKRTIPLFIFFALIFLGGKAFSQDTINFNYINSKTYDYYTKKQWKNLTKLGKLSLKNEIDFYYLQVRMGIAYYEQKKYRKAIPYFENAFKQNEDNALIAEYMYFSYLFAGREKDAEYLARQFTPQLQKKVGADKNPFIKSITLLSTYAKNNETDFLKKFDIDGEDNDFGDQKIINNMQNYAVGFSHKLGRQGDVSYLFSKTFSDETQRLISMGEENTLSYQNIQNQIFINSNFRTSQTWNLNLSLNLISVKTQSNTVERTATFEDFTEHTTLQTINQLNGETIIVDTYDTVFNYYPTFSSEIVTEENRWADFAISGGATKDFIYTKIGGQVTFYRINAQNTFQPNFLFSYFPKGNLNFYLLSTISLPISTVPVSTLGLPKRPGPGNRPTPSANPVNLKANLVLKQTLGFAFCKNIWSETSYTFGKMENYANYNASLIYNTSEPVVQQLNASLVFFFFKKRLKLALSYTLQQKKNVYTTSTLSGTTNLNILGISHQQYTYENGTATWLPPRNITKIRETDIYTPQTNSQLYLTHLITGGLTWYF